MTLLTRSQGSVRSLFHRRIRHFTQSSFSSTPSLPSSSICKKKTSLFSMRAPSQRSIVSSVVRTASVLSPSSASSLSSVNTRPALRHFSRRQSVEYELADDREYITWKPSPDHSILHLKGLPFSSTLADVVNFFQGIPLKTVLMSTMNDFRPNGMAFVEIHNEEYDLAMERDKQYMGDRFVDLRDAKPAHIYSTISRSRANSFDNLELDMEENIERMKKYPIDLTRVLRVRGIGRSDDETVRDFFESIGVEITKIHRFSHNKVWVVLSFKDHKDCLRAISANGQYIGDRFLEMFPLFYSSDVHEQLLAEEGVDDDTEGEEMK